MCCYLSMPALVHKESHRTRGFASRICWPGWAHTRECLTNQAAEDEESREKGYKHSYIRVQPKALSAFRNFLTWAAVAHPPLSSETSWWRLQPGKEAWDLALDTLWWYPGAPDNWLGVNSSPRVWVAGGIFPSAIISTSSWKPGEKLWVNLYRCGWKDPLIDSIGNVTLGQRAVMVMSPADLWEMSPQKTQSHLLSRRSEENSELIQSFLV